MCYGLEAHNASVCMSEKLILSFHPVDSRYWTLVSRLGKNPIYPLTIVTKTLNFIPKFATNITSPIVLYTANIITVYIFLSTLCVISSECRQGITEVAEEFRSFNGVLLKGRNRKQIQM